MAPPDQNRILERVPIEWNRNTLLILPLGVDRAYKQKPRHWVAGQGSFTRLGTLIMDRRQGGVNASLAAPVMMGTKKPRPLGRG
jgi:hypothetical protein